MTSPAQRHWRSKHRQWHSKTDHGRRRGSIVRPHPQCDPAASFSTSCWLLFSCPLPWLPENQPGGEKGQWHCDCPVRHEEFREYTEVRRVRLWRLRCITEFSAFDYNPHRLEFDIDPNSPFGIRCERAAIHPSGHEWSSHHQDDYPRLSSPAVKEGVHEGQLYDGRGLGRNVCRGAAFTLLRGPVRRIWT